MFTFLQAQMAYSPETIDFCRERQFCYQVQKALLLSLKEAQLLSLSQYEACLDLLEREGASLG